ncbi:uncharacterized protein RBU57_016513 [Macrochelys suwanniensis]
MKAISPVRSVRSCYEAVCCLSEQSLAIARGGSGKSPALEEPISLLYDMNGCYSKLRELVPGIPQGTKLSQVEILQHVIDYILDLQIVLEEQAKGQDPAADTALLSLTVRRGARLVGLPLHLPPPPPPAGVVPWAGRDPPAGLLSVLPGGEAPHPPTHPGPPFAYLPPPLRRPLNCARKTRDVCAINGSCPPPGSLPASSYKGQPKPTEKSQQEAQFFDCCHKLCSEKPVPLMKRSRGIVDLVLTSTKTDWLLGVCCELPAAISQNELSSPVLKVG